MTSIVCIGIAVMDQIFSVEELPKTAGKHFASDYFEVGGGPAATAAVTLAKLGAEVEFWGRVGNDVIGERIIAELHNYGVNTRYVRKISASRSTISAVLVDQYGERMIVNSVDPHLDANPHWLPFDALQEKEAVLVDSRWPQAALLGLQHAKKENLPAILDADTTPDHYLAKLFAESTHAVFSYDALLHLTKEKEIESALQKIQQYGQGWVGVTHGEQGTYWIEKENIKHQPSFSVEVIDTLGAGDVFHGAFTLALAEKKTIVEAIRFSNAAAALKCTKAGGRAGIPNRDEIEQLINGTKQ